jgi:hypothetical protein
MSGRRRSIELGRAATSGLLYSVIFIYASKEMKTGGHSIHYSTDNLLRFAFAFAFMDWYYAEVSDGAVWSS